MTPSVLRIYEALAWFGLCANIVSRNADVFGVVCTFGMAFLAVGAIELGRSPRPKSAGPWRKIQRLLGLPMLGLQVAGMTFGFFAASRAHNIYSGLGAIDVIIFFWLQAYLVWKIFLFPNSNGGGGDGGRHPTAPSLSPKPIKVQTYVIRDCGETVLAGLSRNQFR